MDVNLMGQLCTDTNTALTLAQLQSDDRLLAELSAASGRLEAAVLTGRRYDPADLAAFTGVTADYRDKMIAKLAEWAIMADRRPASQKPAAATEVEDDLKRLRAGEWVFGVLEAQDAGVGAELTDAMPLDPQTETVTGVAHRMFGTRSFVS
jgi:hypothetical protein